MADSSSGLPRLTVLSGALAGKELLLEEVVDNILIGADASCRFHLPLPGISPIHARIWMDAAGVTVYDTHSPRGLYVNDDRVSGQVPLKNGDILWLGTPGDEDAIMIQCRLPSRAVAVPVAAVAAPAIPEPPPAADVEAESTVVMAAPLLPAEPEALEVVDEVAAVVPDLDAVDEGSADATMVIAVEAPEPDPVEADATLVTTVEPALVADTDATLVGAADSFYIQDEEPGLAAPLVEEDPERFAVDMAPVAEVAPPEPPAFEDETQETVSDLHGAVPAVPTVVPAYEPDPEPEPTAHYEPPAPTIVAPPPTPVPVRPTAPAAIKPARAAAVTAAPTPPTPPSPRPTAARATSSGAGRNLALGAIGLLVVGGGAFAAWRSFQSKATPPQPPATTLAAVELPPATLAAASPPPTVPPETTPAEPVVEEAVTIVNTPPPSTAPASAATPRPTPAPKTPPTTTPPPAVSAEALRAQQANAQVASLLGQAQTALAARNFDGAAQLYEEVLKLEPQNPQAMDGRGTAQAAAVSLRKAFVPGKTTVRSEKTAKGPAGFDTEDVSVAKAPDYSGRIEFEANPKNVKPGDSYTVLIYLLNDGKKPFKLGSASVTTAVNGAKSGGSIQTRVKDVESQQRVLLTELPAVWQGGTTSWSLEVVLASSRGDTFRNVLTWK